MNQYFVFETISHTLKEEGLIERISSSFNSIYATIGKIIGPLGCISIAVLALSLLVYNDPQSASQTKKRLLIVIGALLLYYLAPPIVSWASTLAG